MATYAIGDVQGCYDSLQALLGRIGVDLDSDRVVLLGDLVNRGPKSLEVLRWAKRHEPAVRCVLGNHDLHLLSAACGARRPRPTDTLAPVLTAPDHAELIAWLRHQPLLLDCVDHIIVHAGLHPQWTADDAKALADEVESHLRGDQWIDLLRAFAAKEDVRWSQQLTGIRRLCTALSVFVLTRVVSADGALDLKFAGPPDQAPAGFAAWFERRALRDARVVFGHWSALGVMMSEHAICIDSGCVWGNALTALRLEDQAIFSQPAVEGGAHG